MTWYSFFSAHIKDYDESINYLNSDRSIYSANLIEAYYQEFIKGNYEEVSKEPDFNPLVEHDFLYEKSMKDIYISLGKLTRQLIVSPKLHAILSEFRIFGCVYFDGIIFRNDHNTRNDYLLYCFYLDLMDKINFPNSIFTLKDIMTRKELEEIQINSLDEYRKIKKEMDVAPEKF